MKPLEKILYETVHRARLSVEELADRMGVSASTLYRAANPNDEGCDLKVKHLIPLMEATRDFSILHALASRLGFVVVKVPRARKMKPEEVALMGRAFTECTLAVIGFVDDELNSDETLVKVNEALIEAAKAKKMVESWGPQGELFKEEV